MPTINERMTALGIPGLPPTFSPYGENSINSEKGESDV